MKMRLTAVAVAAAGCCTLTVAAVQGQSFLGANFTASNIDNSGFIPPDTMGAVGVDHYVEFINGRYSVYRKGTTAATGTAVQTSTLNTFWVNAGQSITNFAFDPRVLYDPYSRRWFACAADAPGQANSFLLAVSNSSDPTTGWTAFKIDSDSNNSNWADFPMLGVNANSVVITANMIPIFGSTNTGYVVVPKADLTGPVPTIANKTSFEDVATSLGETGAPHPVIDMDNSTGLLPVLMSGITFGSIVRANAGITSGTTAQLQNPALTYSVTPSSSPVSGDQPGALTNIHTSDARFRSSPVMNDGDIWAVAHTTSNGRTAIRWFRLDAATSLVREQGVIDDPQLYLMYPSIAVNDLGDVVIGFSATGPNAGQFVSTYYVSGKTAGGTTTFGSIVQTRAGAAEYQRLDGSGRNRWGDYSATSTDPADPSIFWTIEEFVLDASNRWADQVTEIILPQPGEVRWKDAAPGSFTTASNWLAGAAPTGSSHVIFSRSTLQLGAAGYSVSVPSPQTIDRLSVRQGMVTLSLAPGVTVSATNASPSTPSLTVGEFGGSPTLVITGGTFQGAHASVATGSISVGTLVLSTTMLDLSGTLSVGNVGRVVMSAGGSTLLRAAGLSVSGSGKIDLNDNDAVIDYTGGSPLAAIRSLIQQQSLFSTTADASPAVGKTAIGSAEAAALGVTSFDGLSVDSTTVLLKYTYVGDANFSGSVDVNDLALLAAHFQSAGVWSDGDFDGSGFIDTNDLGLLGINWQQGVNSPLGPGSWDESLAAMGLPAVTVPEPSIAFVAAAGLLLRRKRFLAV